MDQLALLIKEALQCDSLSEELHNCAYQRQGIDYIRISVMLPYKGEGVGAHFDNLVSRERAAPRLSLLPYHTSTFEAALNSESHMTFMKDHAEHVKWSDVGPMHSMHVVMAIVSTLRSANHTSSPPCAVTLGWTTIADFPTTSRRLEQASMLADTLAEVLQDAVGSLVSKGLSLLAEEAPITRTNTPQLDGLCLGTSAALHHDDACVLGRRPINALTAAWHAYSSSQHFPISSKFRGLCASTTAPANSGAQFHSRVKGSGPVLSKQAQTRDPQSAPSTMLDALALHTLTAVARPVAFSTVGSLLCSSSCTTSKAGMHAWTSAANQEMQCSFSAAGRPRFHPSTKEMSRNFPDDTSRDCWKWDVGTSTLHALFALAALAEQGPLKAWLDANTTQGFWQVHQLLRPFIIILLGNCCPTWYSANREFLCVLGNAINLGLSGVLWIPYTATPGSDLQAVLPFAFTRTLPLASMITGLGFRMRGMTAIIQNIVSLAIYAAAIPSACAGVDGWGVLSTCQLTAAVLFTVQTLVIPSLVMWQWEKRQRTRSPHQAWMSQR